MNFKKLNPNILINNDKSNKYQNKYIQEENKMFQEPKHNQSLYENERTIKNYNQKLFMTNENSKEYGDILFKKPSTNNMFGKDNTAYKNSSFSTEPAHFNNNFQLINKKKYNNSNNFENSVDSNNNNSLLKDIDLINDNHIQISNSVNRQIFRDKNFDNDEFLQNQIERNKEDKEIAKIIDLNKNELMRKYEELIEDNKLLNRELNERTSKLNKIIKENISLKSEINQLKLGAIKNEQKINYYEEQFNLYKNKDDNNRKIINELKFQNEKMKLNMNKIDNENEKNYEKDFQNQLKQEIEIIKKNIVEINNHNKIQIDNDIKFTKNNDKNLYDENKNLKEKVECLNSENELIKKENKNLLNQNNTNQIKIESYINQINDLTEIIKNKEINNNSFNKNNLNNSNLNQENKNYKKIEENELIKKLKEENKKKKKKINELNLKLEELINKNNNLVEQSKQKQNEIEKLVKEIEEKCNQNKKLKTENNTKIKEYELNVNKYKDELIEKNKLIKILKEDNENKENKINEFQNKKNEKNFCIKKEQSINIIIINKKETKNFESISNYNMIKNDDKKEEIINEKDKNEEKSSKLKEGNNNENKERERKYKTSIRNRFLLKKEEKQEKENKDNIELEDAKNDNNLKFDNKEINELINNKIEIKEKNLDEEKKEERINHGNKLEENKDEVKESIRKMDRKKNYTHKPRFTTKNSNLPILEGKQNILELDKDKELNNELNNKEDKYYLYGIDRNDYFHIFDILNKKYEKMKISQIKLDEKSTTFKKDYQYEGTILYNTLKGLYILTGEKVDTLYYYNSINDTISKICKFNSGHDNGNILYDDINKNIYVLGGKKTKSCEFYNINENKVYKMPDLIIDKANASSIISDGKIFCFFGFSYENNNYSNDIEYIDYNTKDKWIELKDIAINNDITFDMESVATLYYKNKEEEIMIYNGIKGEDEEFITDYYLIYNTKKNEIKKIKSWETKQFKLIGKKWKNYILKKTDLQGFHFAKNTKFLNINNLEGYSNLNILIDYKNNFHFIDQNKEEIDIYRGNI